MVSSKIDQPPIPEDFNSGSDTSGQSSVQEILLPVSETSFPHSQLTQAFSELTDNPMGTSDRKLASAAMRDKDIELATNRDQIANDQSLIMELRDANAEFRVRIARQNEQLGELRRVNWITTFMHVIAAFLLSVGWAEFDDSGKPLVFLIGALMLVACLVTPFFFKKTGDAND